MLLEGRSRKWYWPKASFGDCVLVGTPISPLRGLNTQMQGWTSALQMLELDASFMPEV